MEHTAFSLERYNNIFSYRKICNDTFCFSVFRKVRHAKFHSIQRTVDLCLFAFYLKSSSLSLVCTVNGTYKFRTSGTEKSGKTDNLSFINGKVKWLNCSLVGDSFCFDNRFRFCFFLIFVFPFNISKVIKVFTHHLGNQHNSRKILCLIFSYQFAVTKNCDPVADCIYLFKEMGNKDNTYSFITKSSHKYKQLLNFIVIQ